MTSRGPLTLAALASAAVPGLDPDTVQGVVASGPTDPLDVAFVQDREHRRWVIRCPRTPAASAQLERSAALLAVLARRLTMPVPAVKGWVALPEGGRAAVHSYLTGRLVGLEGIQPGSTLAKGLGRSLAHLHNLDVRAYEEAGVPAYDAAGYRSRRLAELDRAAATGRVPTGLLSRWERVLDDESLWDFRATPTHGALGEGAILASPDDGQSPDVKAFLAWESAQVADPADDIAPLLAAMDAEAFDTVMEAYAHTRVERPDRHLHRRAEIVGEMQMVRTMMSLVAAGDDAGAERSATQLRRLDERIARDEEEAERIHGAKPTGSSATSSGAGSSATKAGAGAAAGAASSERTDEGTPEPADGEEAQPATGDDATQETTDGDAVQETTDGAAETTDTQPVATGTPASDTGTTTDPSEGPARGSSTTTEELRLPRPDRWDASDDGDAVEVEHPARVTPVARAAEDEDEDDAPQDSQTLKPVHESAPDDEPESPQNAQTLKRLRNGADAEDPVTAEIVPIDDDGDDDVVPPRPRS